MTQVYLMVFSYRSIKLVNSCECVVTETNTFEWTNLSRAVWNCDTALCWARWPVLSDFLACISQPQGRKLNGNVTFYSVLGCIGSSVRDTALARIHWRLPRLDINFTQMCPQWAWVHEWMSEHSHTHAAAKPPVWALAWDFIIAVTLLPLLLGWRPVHELNVTFLHYLHGDYNVCLHGFVSVHQIHTFLQQTHQWSTVVQNILY